MVRQKWSQDDFKNSLIEARKDPTFKRDIRKFIKVTTGIYKLKDYTLKC